MNSKRGQIWVETVIYTLIAFSLIGLALSFAKPQIQEMQDKSVLDQSLTLLQGIDNTITEIVEKGPGNKRKLEIALKKGELEIDSENDELIFLMDTKAVYSEPGFNVTEGNIIIQTIEQGEFNQVTMKINYQSIPYNITFKGLEESKRISHSPTPYNLFIENLGEDGTGTTVINIEV